MHRQRNVTERRVVHRALILVGPGRVRKNALDALADFGGCLLLPYDYGQSPGDLFTALGQIFRDVVKYLGAVMGRCFRPPFRFARRFNGIANVFAISKRRFAEQASIRAAHFDAVARIRARLLAADVQLHRAVNRRRRRAGLPARSFFSRKLRGANRRRLLKPNRFEILEQPFPASFASISALAIPAKSAGCVEQIRAVHPNDPGLQLRGDMQRDIDAFTPHARRQAIDRVVRKLHRLAGRAKRHRRENGTENLFLGHDGSRMHVAQQRRREIKTAGRHRERRLPARGAFGDPLVHQALDALQLHAGDNRSDINGLVERRPDAQRAHAVADLGDQRLCDALLHQQARTGAAHFSLVEPDSVDQSLHGAVQVGVFENNERGFAAQFQRKPLVALRRSFADGAPHFGGAGEGDLVHAGVLHQRFAGRAVSGDDIDDACGEPDLLADFREGQRRQWSKLRRLQHHRVSRGDCRRNLPGQHEQREIPRNDLSHHAASRVGGKFLREELRPSGMVVEMPSDQRNINVAAFANGLSVVHCFEHRETPRMLLHLARQGIEVPGAPMRSESLPDSQRATRRFHRGVYVREGSLRNTRKLISRGGICCVEVLPGGGVQPGAVDEVSEPAAVPVEPKQRFARVFRRRAIFHTDEFFDDAHAVLPDSSGLTPCCH